MLIHSWPWKTTEILTASISWHTSAPDAKPWCKAHAAMCASMTMAQQIAMLEDATNMRNYLR